MVKKLLVALAIVGMLGGTVLAFSYWDNLQQSEQEVINVGNGVTLEVAVDDIVPAGKVLVPAGVVMKANDVDSVVLTYNVKLDEAALEALDLEVVASNIEIGGSDVNADLVNIAIVLGSATVNNANVLVTVTVTLDQPATVAVYNAIINQDITFDLTFTAFIAE